MLDKLKRSPLTNIPPILIIGAVLILAPIFVFLTVQTLHRQKENMTRILVEKGAALIRSFEAGTRTGMMGMMGSRWGDPHLQRLLTETAKQSDIVYLAVVGADGTIIAHSDESKIGEFYDSGLDLEQISHTNTIQWRQIQLKDGLQVLEVYRRFAPSLVPPHFRPHHGMMGGRGRRPLLPPEPPPPEKEIGRVIFVGLDMGPIEAARLADAKHTVFMTITLLFIGIAGTVTLYLSQVYRSTKAVSFPDTGLFGQPGRKHADGAHRRRKRRRDRIFQPARGNRAPYESNGSHREKMPPVFFPNRSSDFLRNWRTAASSSKTKFPAGSIRIE